jgi:hypothetical protein
MKTTFELWDTEHSTLVGTYPTERAALAIVRNAVKKHGSAVMKAMALGREDDRGVIEPVATGDALVKMAMRGERDGRLFRLPRRIIPRTSYAFAVRSSRRVFRKRIAV